MSKAKATLIISAYRNIEYLSKVFESIQFQTDKRFEIIVSEDCEYPEMKEFLSGLSSSLNILHLSQPDLGWRKNLALNRAVLAANTNYFVFIDEDCVLHPRFMEFHLKHANDRAILAGKRIKLDPITTRMILENALQVYAINNHIVRNFFKIKKQGGRFVEEGLFLNPRGLFGFIPALRSMYQLKGCNMSFSRKALYAINGFDEDYIRPAIGEDIDLTWRFEMAGYRLRSLRNLAVQYHLYHPEGWVEQEENVRMMKHKQAQSLFICRNGINKL